MARVDSSHFSYCATFIGLYSLLSPSFGLEQLDSYSTLKLAVKKRGKVPVGYRIKFLPAMCTVIQLQIGFHGPDGSKGTLKHKRNSYRKVNFDV